MVDFTVERERELITEEVRLLSVEERFGLVNVGPNRLNILGFYCRPVK